MSKGKKHTKVSPTPSLANSKISFHAFVSLKRLIGFRKWRLWIEIGCQDVAKKYSEWERLLKKITS
jgi:hypothetical protein